MYRACGLKALREGIHPKDEEKVEKMLKKLDIDIRFKDGEQRVFLDGIDVSAEIRAPQVSVAASDISSLSPVREKMVFMQREISRDRSVVLDGRDIGSHVLPQAKYKFFLVADSEERAKRRLEELKLKGISATYDDVLEGILYRDKQDSTRSIAPLMKMPDAIEIDTTYNTPEQTLAAILSYLSEILPSTNEK